MIVAIAAVPVLLCVAGILIALLLPAVQAARAAAQRSTCRNNLKYLGLAMHNYHETYGSFPPPYLADANGKPMHSWRVLLLPFLDAADLYARYDFNEPWDGPHNQQLAAEMPEVFRCPSAMNSSDPMTTNYVAVVGPGYLFDANRVNRYADVLDGLSQTIALVESSGPFGANIHWMSPEDIPAERLPPTLNSPPGPAIASQHLRGVNMLMGDASIYFIQDDLPASELRAMLTIWGREPVAPLNVSN
ncbi:MAG: DUF1559 domain-containing protein [Pirellulales bacterium]|nr:DUF1559 domain-containing protein [Pirellulales bacterium]